MDWFSRSARDLPWRQTRDPYAIWVSEIMLQQTRAETVRAYWNRWMGALPTIQAAARAKPERIHKLWEGLGYYSRVRNLQRAAQIIMAEHDGALPRDYETVLSLPGVGRYTAGAICSIAFNQPTPILDGNVIRVLSRLFALTGDPKRNPAREIFWTIAGEMVSTAGRQATAASNACSRSNQALMELGATVCLPRQPRCDLCPVARRCEARRLRRIAEFPQLPSRAPATRRRFAAFIAERGERFLVRQRPVGVANAHLWEFPNLELGASTDLHCAAEALLGGRPRLVEPVSCFQHSITRYRITLEVYRAEGKWDSRSALGSWLPKTDLRRLAFCAAHKRILGLLANPS
ncbi:MAG TPA: A/G-specific adenine glycosylase [Verrucomicrobiae bacterium]|nr:A/G-specific adenine glycosylase [Verrucomicrobiae bacterium]